MQTSITDIRRPLLAAGIGLIALTATPLRAEQAAPAATTPEAEEAEGNDSEILVTARRREERAQDVPIALSAVGGETIERAGALNLIQIADLTPSLVIRNNNARNTFVNIRGLGSNSDQNDGLEIGVGFYVDDVYYGRIGSSQFDLIDLERVEVLRGPQGTLFGKNTTAGAISIATRAPQYTTEFRGEATLGERGFHQVRGSLSGPLIDDKLAYRLTISDTHRDGLLYNVFNGGKVNDYDNFSVRGQLLAEPTDTLSIRVIGDYSKQSSYSRITSAVGVFTTFDNGAPNTNNFLDRAARAGYVPPYDLNDPFGKKVDFNAPIQADMEGYGVSGKIDWDLGKVALTSITAYRWWDWYPLNDQDNTSLTVNIRGGTSNLQRQFSQEFRLASQGENKIDYVAGAYYFWQVVKALGQYALGPDYAIWNNPNANRTLANYAYTGFQSDSVIEPRTRSYAAFGQLTWHATDAFSVTGGLRFTHEDKTGLFDQRTVAGNDLSVLNTADRTAAQKLRDDLYPEVRYTTGLKDDALTGSLNIAYKVAPDVLAYASYARGSKSGGLSLGTLPAGVSSVVKPETIDAYEIGLKSQFWERRVTFNAAAYWTDVKNYQAAISEQIGNTTSFRRYISNIPGVRSRGFEVDLVVAPTRWVRFTASAAYTDAVYKDYVNAQAAPDKRNISQIQDLSGVQLANAPKFLYNFAIDLSQPIGDDEVYGRIDYNHRSSNDTSGSNSQYTRIAGYGIANLRAGVRIDDSRFDVSVWATNLFDKKYFTALSAANTGLISGNIGDPQALGVTLRTRF
ncbi:MULTISPECIES: TonB-dependent receptor [unclassified Sphingomonas]|uniref:TonB-dependent receptor n=1 Tax=unclassified Sphingomonas TaxID=196159 RepID=UPI0006FD529B|nr:MULTISPECIES: TonB-dependent receptor [unclassified Sphingomonas]KQX19269.1 TonB-dependent receptor [Sphingomonas sp. Root1294]KQY65473.1 TonB-dependent receptor [Sphingomonas sp. Root50]KRB95229.1 TonB-dependent receptor [Sphingomonas sp. Root720]